MKVFISHQQTDGNLALRIAERLRRVHSIDCYLDLVDPGVRSGEDLADHIRTQLGRCSQLLAVVSQATQASWWVPWEIGVASEKDYPLATFSGGGTLPEYLRKWPYLTTEADLDSYARASRTAERELRSKKTYLNEAVARERTTRDFYRNLRASLSQ